MASPASNAELPGGPALLEFHQAEASVFRSRHRQTVASAIVLFAARVLAAILQLRIVEKVWGGQYSGLNALSNQVLLYVTLLELGLSQSAIVLLYKPIVECDFTWCAALVRALRRDARRLAAIGLLVFGIALVIYAHVVRTAIPYHVVLLTLCFIAANGFMQLVSIHFQAYLNAAERIDRVNYVLAGGYIAKTALGLFVAIATGNYLWLPAFVAILSLLEFALLRMAFLRTFPAFPKLAITVGQVRAAAASVRAKARFVVAHKAAGLAYYQSDFIILSLTASLFVVRDYAKYQYITAAILSLIGMVANALTATIARHQMRQGVDGRRRQYAVLQLAVCLVAATVLIGYQYSASIVVGMAFGVFNVLNSRTLLLFSMALFLNIVKCADDTFITARGAFEPGFWLPLIEAPSYVLMGVLLSRRYGIAGILVASIASNLLVPTLLRGLITARRIYEMAPLRWFGTRFRNVVFGGLLASPLLALHWAVFRTALPPITKMLVGALVAVAYCMLAIPRVLARGFTQQEAA
jgi:hypothetical protein